MHSGIRVAHIDPAVRPQDDLFGHVNGRWVAGTEIPADRGRYGSFDILLEEAEVQLRDIIEATAAGGSSSAPGAGPDSTTSAAKVVALYQSFMDEAAVESAGLAGLHDLLDAIAGLQDTTELPALLGRLAHQGVDGAFQAIVNTDDRQSDRYIVYLNQGGLGLPDESYYHEERHGETRTAYLAHVEAMLRLAGHADPAAAAARVMALETRLAAGHLDKVADRDPVATYTLLTSSQCDGAIPTPSVPARMRSMKPAEMMNTSSSTTCLRPIE